MTVLLKKCKTIEDNKKKAKIIVTVCLAGILALASGESENLGGTYVFENEGFVFFLTFNNDGKVTAGYDAYYGNESRMGTYSIKEIGGGERIFFSGDLEFLDIIYLFSDNTYGYSFSKEDNSIFMNGIRFIKK